MDALKSVPQFFFDAIARVAPGSVAILLCLVYTDPEWTRWSKFLKGILGGFSGTEIPSTFIALLLLLGAYITGHLISPLTKLIQWVSTEVFWPLNKERHENEEKLESKNYAWLRMNRPDAGGHCAKLRAEFTMYNSLSATFLLAAILLLLFHQPPPCPSILGYIVLGFLMCYRGREGRKTFSEAVKFFRSEADPSTAATANTPASTAATANTQTSTPAS